MIYLLPNVLHETQSLPPDVCQKANELTSLIAESEKEGRRFLKRVGVTPVSRIQIYLLNEHSTPDDKRSLIEKIKKGGMWGLVSDCGMPCIADPGADLVLMARSQGILVEAFSGPSSILLALVLSGLGGQHFIFHGYLPKEEQELIRALKALQQQRCTHLFIETPYRNQRLVKMMLSTLSDQTWLCLAVDLTAPGQYVQTKKVQQWKREELPLLEKRPTTFVIKP